MDHYKEAPVLYLVEHHSELQQGTIASIYLIQLVEHKKIKMLISTLALNF